MSEPADIVAKITEILGRTANLQGKKILVTAGSTRERLDPVRFLTNDSSGKMGFAIAEAARDRGAEVTLVKGNTTAPVPGGVRIVEIESARDLLEAMKKEAPKQDVVIQAAAVADYRPATTAKTKIKKKEGEPLSLTLTENPDIAKTIGAKKKANQVFVGFAAETDHVAAHAQAKLKSKNLDMIVANDVTKPGAGFNTDTNIATLITKDASEDLPIMSKRELADVILDRILR
jgi:phosphopantothenoylcysteine decarboxylase/phosphopantothenate--cysteine ligase